MKVFGDISNFFRLYTFFPEIIEWEILEIQNLHVCNSRKDFFSISEKYFNLYKICIKKSEKFCKNL